MDNTFLLGFVFSEAAANVPTSAFLVCHGHRCKLPAELQQRLEEERKKEKEKKKRGILTAFGFPLKCSVSIFSKIRMLIRP